MASNQYAVSREQAIHIADGLSVRGFAATVEWSPQTDFTRHFVSVSRETETEALLRALDEIGAKPGLEAHSVAGRIYLTPVAVAA